MLQSSSNSSSRAMSSRRRRRARFLFKCVVPLQFVPSSTNIYVQNACVARATAALTVVRRREASRAALRASKARRRAAQASDLASIASIAEAVEASVGRGDSPLTRESSVNVFSKVAILRDRSVSAGSASLGRSASMRSTSIRDESRRGSLS